jgi:hypothetical protein
LQPLPPVRRVAEFLSSANFSMSRNRALSWGAISGSIFGLGMLLLAIFLQSQPPGYHGTGTYLLMVAFAVVHWPLNELHYYRLPNFFYGAAVLIGYWISIGVAAAFLFWLFHDCRVRGFRRHRMLLVCGGWVLGTFALHCWALHALAGMPSWAGAKQASEDQTMALNSLLTSYEGSPEDRARARAAMQMQMPPRQMPGRPAVAPSVEQKLGIALRMEENAQNYLQSVASMADSAQRRTARRAWVSWATIAFTPVTAFALVAVRAKRLAKTRQPGASPNGGPASLSFFR